MQGEFLPVRDVSAYFSGGDVGEAGVNFKVQI
jgi:hypothetical protein